MFCFMFKWFVSSAMDTGKPLSTFVRRHINSCSGCKRFADAAGILDKQLAAEAEKFILPADGQLEERIIAALNSPVSNQSGEVLHAGDSKVTRFFNPSRRLLGPALAAALVVLLVTAGIWLMVSPMDSGSQFEENSTMQLPVFQVPNNTLQKITDTVESPLQQEVQSLENAAKSAKNFFAVQLNVKLGS
ncbi:MAG: hypothetical protein GY765_27155 [bacterium]|nr:hypothetical protein [bacterium]